MPEPGGGTGAGTATRLADAVALLPPSVDVTFPVTLLYVPAAVSVALTLNVHGALAASVAIASVMLFEQANAVIVPRPQLPTRSFVVDITSPG